MEGKTLNGRYVLGRLLGKGGMGAVYEAEDIAEQRRVAVKLINPAVTLSQAVRARFEREARAASAVQTEHIVRVLDTGADGDVGSPYMVMERLCGEDLAEVLERLGPLPSPVALRVVAQACVGLQRAHDAGVVHRDIKPGNLFLARRDRGSESVVKLLDFGIAKIKQANDPRLVTADLTRTGAMLGTLLYMSPEQARGIKEIDHRTDIWSLGIVLYRLLAGRTPHESIEAYGDLIAALVADDPTPIQELAPWIAPDVAAVVHGALQRSPEARYPSASAMLAAVRRVVGDDTAIDAGMLVPLPPSERETVAPKLSVAARPAQPQRALRAGGSDPWETLSVDAQPVFASVPTEDALLPSGGATASALAVTEEAPPPRDREAAAASAAIERLSQPSHAEGARAPEATLPPRSAWRWGKAFFGALLLIGAGIGLGWARCS